MNRPLQINNPFQRAAGGWNLFWFAPCPRRPLDLFRLAHGGALLAYLSAWWFHAAEWLTNEGFHFPDAAVSPLPRALLPAFGLLQFGVLILFMLGWKPRLTAAMSWICLLYVTLADEPSAFSINSIYLFTFAVLTVFPGNPLNTAKIQVAPIRLLQFGMIAIYFSSGWNKAVYGDWLDSPTMLWTALQGIYMTDLAAWLLRTMPIKCWLVVQYAIVTFELLSPILFFTKRLRWVGILLGCTIHLGIALLMDQLIYFSLQMMSFYVLFLSDQMPSQEALPSAVRKGIPCQKHWSG